MLRLLCALLAASLLGCASADDRSPEEHFSRGSELWERESRADDAARMFEAGLVKDPSHEQMRLKLARIYYEKGEEPHLQQRRLVEQAIAAEARKETDAAARFQVEADLREKEASQAYRAANVHLDALIEESSDKEVLAHAYFLRFRTATFFKNWKVARESLKQAIEHSDLKGMRRAKFEGFLEELEAQTPRPIFGGERPDVSPGS